MYIMHQQAFPLPLHVRREAYVKFKILQENIKNTLKGQSHDMDTFLLKNFKKMYLSADANLTESAD